MQRPKGTRDLFGPELLARYRVLEVLRGTFRRYCFKEVETPVFEYLELFTVKSGQTIVNQLYSFKDKSGRDLALRPELTAPVMRLYIQKLRSEPKPVKLCYTGNCFRYEEPQAGRWRQFLQAGAEIIGSSLPSSDAEIISMADQVFTELGIRAELVVGHLLPLRSFLSSLGLDGSQQDRLLRAIDSGDEQRLQKELDSLPADETDRNRLRELIGLRGGRQTIGKARELVKLPQATRGLDNLAEVLDIIEDLGIRYTVNLGLARGLDYYTGCVFEFYAGGWQVAGGGRYDNLIELLGGEPTPAVGIGFGVDRMARFIEPPEEDAPEFMILPVSREEMGLCMKIARELRLKGRRAEVELLGRKLSKGLEFANTRGVRKVIIVGKRDLQHGMVTVRDMRSGEQKTVRLEELI